MHFQLEGLCEALRLIVQSQAEAGDATFQLLQKMYADSIKMTHGKCVHGLPKPSRQAPVADWLSIAECLRHMSLGFLSPEEHQERCKLGF